MAWPPERITEMQKQESLMLISTAVIKWQMKVYAKLCTCWGISLSVPFPRLLIRLNKTDSWRTQWLSPSEKCTLSTTLCCFSSNKLSVQESPFQFLNSFWCKTLSKSFWKSKSLLADRFLLSTWYQHPGRLVRQGFPLQEPWWLPNRLYVHVLSDLIFYCRQLCHFLSDGG